MGEKNISITLTVDRTPEETFEAITNVSEWWSPGVDGETKQLNDEFTYRNPPWHVSTQRLIEVVPGKKVVWLITDSNLTFVKDGSEWTGTTVSFEISEKEGRTQLSFTHHGLTPEKECYKDCSNGWAHYIGCLGKLISEGKG